MSEHTMRAVTIKEFGGPEVLTVEEVARPEPLPTEVLVRVHAAGINPVDWKTREGQGMAGLQTLPLILGWDVSGVVEEVGFGVTTLEGRRRGVRHAVVPARRRRLRRVRDRAGPPVGPQAGHPRPRARGRRAAGGADRLAGRGRHRPRRRPASAS